MRVLHILKTSVGAAWALREIRELVKLGIDVHVALPPGGPLVGRYSESGATEHIMQFDFPVRKPWNFPMVARRFRQLVEQLSPDIIHSHFVGTTLTMRLALGRNHAVPRVFQVPGPLHLENPFFRRAEIVTAGSLDFWIGSCRWTCQRYKQSGIPNDRIFLSYYGCDLDHLQLGERGFLRSELGLSETVKIIGMVAFIYAPKRYLGQKRGLKGHEDLIDAVKLCLKAYPNIRCVMVGGPWDNATNYERSVKRYARQHCGDRVTFLGTRDDIPNIYADIDVAVHPSHSENVGGAGESCLLGVPTIATKVGGFPDIVHDGITGWLVPPKNPKALAKAMLEALHNPMEAQRRAQDGQKLAKQLFDVRRTAAEIVDIYKEICPCCS